MINNCEENCKQFLVLPNAREICAINQVTGKEVNLELQEGEILLNPGDIWPKNFEDKGEGHLNTKYIREITRIKKSIEFNDVEVVEGGKAIFNARLIKNIEFKVSHSPVCMEFSGIIAFKVIEIPFAGFIEIRGADCGDKVKLEGFVDGELDRPRLGIPFISINEMGGEEEVRLLQKLPGAVILTEKTIVKICGQIVKKELSR